ncbi:MAG: cupredoxin domain-containing protein [Proteobacteria bacterium]|nr:cupredoxin domain-containing protein [Pseudomonadota bacterium]
MRRPRWCVVVVVLAMGYAGLNAREGEAKARPGEGAARKGRQPQVVALTVTSEGFVPAQVKASAGRPLELVVTRTVERTCASDLVIKDYGINRPLPLNQAVRVSFTPTKPGRIRYACAMDMIAGVIVVE